MPDNYYFIGKYLYGEPTGKCMCCGENDGEHFKDIPDGPVTFNTILCSQCMLLSKEAILNAIGA